MKNRLIRGLVLTAIVVFGLEAPLSAQIEIGLEEVAGGFQRPIYVTHAGDGSDRLFVVERGGKIKVVNPDGNVLPTPFLDLGPTGLDRAISPSPGDGQSEQGLLGLAFHPDYSSNGRFFVHYSELGTGATIIGEYQISSDPNIADPTEILILREPQPAGNHNGGQIAFNPYDGCPGCLYIGLGDGGGGGDTFMNGQNINTILGAIIRVDIDAETKGTQNYGIPPDNPFVGVNGRDEIWAYGLRNPYRFSFDRDNGRLFVGDVGQETYEEIDLVEKGDNLGWNIMEGFHCYPPSTSNCNMAGLKLPIAEYNRLVGFSVTGGYVYRGSQFPSIQGIYFFGDYGSGRILSLEENETTHEWSEPIDRLDAPFNISGFGESEQGEIYLLDFGATNGKVHHLVNLAEPVTPMGDLNQDGQVNAVDLIELVDQFRNTEPSQGFQNGDVDGTPGVALPDVLDLAPNWKEGMNKESE